MAEYSGAVYEPPRSDAPYIAVICDPRGNIIVARAVSSPEAGERLIQQTSEGLARMGEVQEMR